MYLLLLNLSLSVYCSELSEGEDQKSKFSFTPALQPQDDEITGGGIYHKVIASGRFSFRKSPYPHLLCSKFLVTINQCTKAAYFGVFSLSHNVSMPCPLSPYFASICQTERFDFCLGKLAPDFQSIHCNTILVTGREVMNILPLYVLGLQER